MDSATAGSSSRLAQFVSRLVETGWLAALIVIPIFFNVWSNRVFEPDKLTLLRSIALVMVVAVAIWFAETRTSASKLVEMAKGGLRVPLVAPLLALTGAYALSTALSIVPRQSLTGSYQRLQGLYTWLAYVVLFLAVVGFLHRRGQLDRLLAALIVPSLPVALYGIIQSRGLDPMPWLGDVTLRVASTMGNSIFVAAYLVLVAPITLVKAFDALRSLDTDEEAEDSSSLYVPASVLRAAAYMVLFLVQIIGIVLSQSRGPALGLGGALFLLVVLGAALHADAAKRRVLTAVVYVAFGVVPAVFLLALNLAGEDNPIASLRDAPYIGRMGRVFETEGGTGKVRVLIWGGAIDLITSDPLRAVVGYGPESMHVAYNPHYPPELAHYESRNASPDRSHNETLDTLATTGILGFAAYVALFTSVFYFAMKWLGLLNDGLDRGLFLLLWFGGGIVASLAFYVWRGDMTFVGVALPAGMVLGLVNYVALRAVLGRPVVPRAGRLIVAGLTAAIVAHFIETNFGIAIAATRTVFFVMAGLLLVVGGLSEVRPDLLGAASDLTRTVPTPTAGRRKKQSRARPARRVTAPVKAAWTSYALIMLVLLATMVFDFFVRANFGLDDPKRRIEIAVMVWLFTLTWGVGSLPLISEVLTRPGGSTTGLWRYLGITLGGSALYGIVHQVVLRGGSGADTSSMLLWLYYAVLFGVMAWLAYTLTRLDPEPESLVAGRMPWAYGIVAVLAVVLILFTNVNEVRADIYYKEAWAGYHAQANQFQARGDTSNARTYYDGALASYDRAMALDKSEDYYLLFKGKALLEQADGQADSVDAGLPADAASEGFSEYGVPELSAAVSARDNAFERAMTVLRQAYELAPGNTDHAANLGRAFQVWGERTFDGSTRAERFAESRRWFEEAIALSPNNAGLRTELATTDYLAGDTEAALAGIDSALALDDEYGRPYRLRATIHREEGDWAAARDDYERYVETRDGRGDAVGWSGLAYVLGKLEDIDGAIVANEKVLELAPGDAPTMRNLVLLYRDLGDVARACDVVERGMQILPDEPSLPQLALELGCGDAVAPASPPAPAAPASSPTPAPPDAPSTPAAPNAPSTAAPPDAPSTAAPPSSPSAPAAPSVQPTASQP